MGLPDRERSLTMSSAVVIQYTNVRGRQTDGQTDGHRETAKTAKNAQKLTVNNLRAQMSNIRQSVHCVVSVVLFCCVSVQTFFSARKSLSSLYVVISHAKISTRN